jgi:hypothetical protein
MRSLHDSWITKAGTQNVLGVGGPSRGSSRQFSFMIGRPLASDYVFMLLLLEMFELGTHAYLVNNQVHCLASRIAF